MKRLLIAAAGLACAFGAAAGPTSGEETLLALRPYGNNTHVYVHVATSALCSTSVFIIDTGVPNGKEMYAAALTALASGKKVQLEVSNATGCAGWGTRLQSFWILG